VPWPERQRRAIAADMARKGKSREEIAAFFRRHGYGRGNALMNAARRHGKDKR
jgi:hypothetical protein